MFEFIGALVAFAALFQPAPAEVGPATQVEYPGGPVVIVESVTPEPVEVVPSIPAQPIPVCAASSPTSGVVRCPGFVAPEVSDGRH